MNNKILVTPRSLTGIGHPSLDILRQAGYEPVFCTPGRSPGEKELTALLPGCVGYLAGVEPITAKALAAADNLKVISRNGTGVDNIDQAASRARGIVICRAAGANAQGVAELTMGLILALARSVPFSDQQLKQGQWARRKGIELAQRTLGLVGCGKVGRLVAGYALAFRMKINAFDPFPVPCFAGEERFRFANLDAVLAESDIISFHCPSPENGRPLVSDGTLSKMRRGVYLVNTARAALVDEAALLKALESDQVAGFATDVFLKEPPGDNALLKHPRVIATPHVGGFTGESIDRATSEAVQNLLNHLKATPAASPAGETSTRGG